MPLNRLDEHRLRRLLEVGRSLVSELDLEAVLRRVLEVARELTGAQYAALGIVDAEHGDQLERFIVSGIDDETHRTIGDLPRGRGILGELIRRPEPLRLDDLSGHPRSYGFPPGHPPMVTFLGVPVLIRGEAYGNLYLTEKEGGEPFVEDDEAALIVLADWAAIAIANARLYEGVERRRSELERAVRGLEATTAIAKAIGGETDLNRVLELIVKRARALVDARTVLILLEDEGHLVLAASAGESRPTGEDLRIPIAGSVPGTVLEGGRPERLADVQSTVRLEMGGLVGEASTALLVPLTFRGKSSGLLVAFDRLIEGPEFDAEDERLLAAFAASAGTAVATAQSVEAQRLRDTIEAAEQERVRWARELHDETLQGLGALQVLLSSGRHRPAADVTEEAVAHIATEIQKLQALITELRPAALDEIGLGPAITTLMKRAQGNPDFDPEVELELDLDYEAGRCETRLELDIESTLYRLVQEALTNVGKHAGADHVEVSIIEADGHVRAIVHDDGGGFDPAAVKRGFGLVGMRERLNLVAGTVEMASVIGEGTTVTAVVPARHIAGPADMARTG